MPYLERKAQSHSAMLNCSNSTILWSVLGTGVFSWVLAVWASRSAGSQGSDQVDKGQGKGSW